MFVHIVNCNNAGKRDFICYWAAGHALIHGANPYSFEDIQALERTAGYNLSYHLIMRNPPVALFLALPLGYLGPNAGLVVWLAALLASLVASIRMLWKMQGSPPNRLHLLGYCFAPVMECLMAGQFGIFLLFGIVLFLYFHKSRPFLAGAALLLCATKPHLFILFGIVLLLWIFHQKAYRILAGSCVALLASCLLAFSFDPHVWSQYLRMMSASGIMNEIVPSLSEFFRLIVDRNAPWVQFLPQAAGCCWAVWYFWARRGCWNWMDQGLLVLLVSVLCAPYALLTDEAVVLPAVLAGVYRADDSGRSLLPFGLLAGVAIMEVLIRIPITSAYYLWTPLAWLGWYLYATKSKHGQPAAAPEPVS